MLMLIVVLAAVSGGEAREVVVMGRLVARSDCGDRQAVFSGGTSAADKRLRLRRDWRGRFRQRPRCSTCAAMTSARARRGCSMRGAPLIV